MYPFSRFNAADLCAAARDKALQDLGFRVQKPHPLTEVPDAETDLTLSGLAAQLGGRLFEARGRPLGSRIDAVQAGMSTSDFTAVLDQITRTLLTRTFEKNTSHRALLQQIPAKDFREFRVGDIQADAGYGPTNERGEFARIAVSEAGESLQVGRYGGILDVSAEVVVNDSLGLIRRAVAEIAAAAARYEARKVFELITNPPALVSGAFWNATNTSSIASLAVGELGKVSAVLRGQAVGEDPLGLAVAHVVCNPISEFTLRNLFWQLNLDVCFHVTTTCPESEVYFLASPDQHASFAIGFLDGASDPVIDRERKPGIATAGTRYRVTASFGLAPVSRVGTVKATVGD